MLDINLLPWRDYSRAQKKKWFLRMVLLKIFLSVTMFFLLHKHLNRELHNIQESITNLTHQSEQWSDKKPEDALMSIQKMMKNIRFNQDQMKDLLHAMLLHKKIFWRSIQSKKGKIIVYGYADQISDLLHFVDYMDATRYLRPMIKSIKMHTQFDSAEFHLQMHRLDVGLKKNAVV